MDATDVERPPLNGDGAAGLAALAPPRQRPAASDPKSVQPANAAGRAAARATPSAVLALVPALLLLGGFALWHSGVQPLWEDETYSLLFARQPLAALLHSLAATEPHLPPYFLALRAWELLAGPSAYAERWPSAACWLLTGVVVWRMARLLGGPRAGWLALACWAIQPEGFWYGQEVRMYAPLVLWEALTPYLLLRALRADRPGAWFLVSLSELAALWTHYAGLLVVAATVALVLCCARATVRPRALAAAALPLLTYLPWLWYVRRLAPPTARPAGTLWQQAFEVGRELLFGFGGPALPMMLTAGVAVAAALAAVAALLVGAPPLRRAALAAATPPLVPLLLPPLHFFFSGRYLSETAPLLCVLWGVALVALARRTPPLAVLAGGALAVASLAGLWVVLAPGFREWYTYPAATAYVRGHERPGEAFITNSGTDPTARYYYQRIERGTLPVVLLPAVHHDSVAATAQAAQRLGQQYTGLWLVQDASGTWDGDLVAPRALALSLPQTAMARVGDVTVRHYLTPKGLAAQRAAPAGAVFGDSIRLASFGVQAMGQELLVSLQWQALRPVDEDYTVFVHLVDRAGRLVAQHDGPPVDGRQPTSRWVAGTTVADLHRLSWAGDPAVVALAVGWYDPQSGRRLPLPGGATDSLALGPLAALLRPAAPAAVPPAAGAPG